LQHDRLLIDLRTVAPEEEALLAAAIEKAYGRRSD
jgi:hypothetical protein